MSSQLLDDIEKMKRKLEDAGYIFRHKDECPTCHQIINGPHFCPGPEKLGYKREKGYCYDEMYDDLG